MLGQLARLHQRILPTLLSELGLPFVERYYRAAQSVPAVIGYCAIGKGNGLPCGFVVGTPQPSALNARLRQPLSWFFVQMLQLLLRRPHLIWQLLVSVRSAAGEMAGETNAIELTYLGVAPEQRGDGLGSRLLRMFLDASREAGYQKVVLSVETDNTPAIQLYRKAGFVIRKTFCEGRFERHRMEIELREG